MVPEKDQHTLIHKLLSDRIHRQPTQ